MNNKIFIGVTSLIIMLVVLTGWDRYETSSLPASLPAFNKQEVAVLAKVYTPEESKTNLNRDLVARGYKPIQVTIENNSHKSLSFSADSISLRVTDPKDVALKVSSGAIPRAIAYKIASSLFWPFLLPSTVDTIRTLKAHQLMKKDFHAKSVKEKEEVITPYSTISRILFVKEKDFQEDLTISLVDKDTGELTNYRCKLTEEA